MTANRRLLRTEALLGKAGIEKLQNSTVMIVGLGAVGGYALEALARSGIGHLILVDFDVIEETNVNRQILAVGSTIGMLKTEAARVRVREINPDCRVEILNLFVNSGTIPELLSHRADGRVIPAGHSVYFFHGGSAKDRPGENSLWQTQRHQKLQLVTFYS